MNDAVRRCVRDVSPVAIYMIMPTASAVSHREPPMGEDEVDPQTGPAGASLIVALASSASSGESLQQVHGWRGGRVAPEVCCRFGGQRHWRAAPKL